MPELDSLNLNLKLNFKSKVNSKVIYWLCDLEPVTKPTCPVSPFENGAKAQLKHLSHSCSKD